MFLSFYCENNAVCKSLTVIKLFDQSSTSISQQQVMVVILLWYWKDGEECYSYIIINPYFMQPNTKM